ncbi:MAG TPA: iron-containing alcohol dehydrogenase [Spirochaetia bacterium]|nr:iron-containing alcohol dehydrogenase [Spirochaetia bacterium]
MSEHGRLPLRKYNAPEILFGEGAARKAGSYALRFGASKVLLVTDPGVRAAGIVGPIEDSLKEAGLGCVVFDGVSPNPRDEEARAGLELYRERNCDLIVAVGGGSPMDCAKGIGLSAANGRDVLEFEGIDAVPEPGPPLLCVPTTAGTSADVSQFAIINDTKRHVKIAIVSKKAIPDAALVDPLATVTMPPELTAATGMDALVHAMEAYVSTAASALTDIDALEAARLVAANLPGAVADGGNLERRSGMTLASLLAGRAFSNASLGVVHAMAHALGGALDLPHGVCNALLLEAAVAANYQSAAARYDEFAAVLARGLGEEAGTGLPSLLGLIRRLKSLVGLDYGLARLGLKTEDIPRLAGFALKDACLVTNPRVFGLAELEAIYAGAL